ncbi:extracellular solute-binding protein [Methylococcus sp. EFPC2]|uniref:extracellular solute-binding protein n=1 Tax=Methylococcus sp. EFPC2 TaxID=2812648 RepID=UPI0019675896|nr:extracellular solute-binding protein [Methylococcus sp. EFPC2]QSA98234.1 ABC transporter substrate-binding protein [Methylococcus sp. EFPC2]
MSLFRLHPRLPHYLKAVLLLVPLGSHPVLADYGIAQYGKLKYPAGFHHFDYLNPDAPKEGTLVLPNPDRRTSFDKFNPFTLKGNPAPGVSELMFESLAVGSSDEIGSAYGLLAEDIAVAPNKLSVRFRLNPQARFSNGDPVLAQDVKYSFDTLVSPLASPAYRSYFSDVTAAVVESERVVRFDFKQENSELPLIVATGLPVFSPKWGLKADGSVTPFDTLAFEPPIGSGPYVIEKYDGGRNISFRRNPDWWAKDLNVRRGMFNFATVTFHLYKDDIARLEAFKAGEFDAVVENRAKSWVRRYEGSRFRSGELLKREFPQHNGAGMQGFIMNLRRPLFADVRVRKALILAMDFEWLNRQLFFDRYTRLDSYFANTEMAASSTPGRLPDAGELAVLEPLRGQLPPEVFGPLPPPPSTAPPGSLRDNLRQARELLAEAGWTYRDGALRDAQGRPLEFEILEDDASMSRITAALIRNWEKLGVRVTERLTDFALYGKRLDSFDFDMTSLRYPDVQSPGNEQVGRFGSEAAKQPGSENYLGVQSPAVDALIDRLLRAASRDEQVTIARALDRVLMHGHYVIPDWYLPTHWVAYRRTLGFAETLPLYYAAGDWILTTWWRQPESTSQP